MCFMCGEDLWWRKCFIQCHYCHSFFCWFSLASKLFKVFMIFVSLSICKQVWLHKHSFWRITTYWFTFFQVTTSKFNSQELLLLHTFQLTSFKIEIQMTFLQSINGINYSWKCGASWEWLFQFVNSIWRNLLISWKISINIKINKLLSHQKIIKFCKRSHRLND